MIHGITYPYRTLQLKLETGETISYIDEGKGRPIVFLHGLANYALGWKKNIDVLSRQFRCIVPDLPGNGLSPGGDYAYGITYFRNALLAFLNKLKLPRVILAGHSMGGQIALTVALTHPDVAEMLVLCAPAGFEQFTPLEATMYQAGISFFDLFSSDEQNLQKLIRSSFYHHSGQADDMVADLIRVMHQQPLQQYRKMVSSCIQGMLHEPVYHSLHLIKTPSLIIFGERDALIPNKLLHPTTTRKIAEDAVSRMPNARLHLLPQAGHFVQWERSREVNSLITDFLK